MIVHESLVNTCDVSIVLLEIMGFHTLAPILLIDVNFMAKGNLSMIPLPGIDKWLALGKITEGTIFLVFPEGRKLGSGQP